ncbi:hypothetical protein ELQ90_00760 [Labedella phragmitis]|uniref:Uncharacterized protein n=1 Tax=Labedella phragmitis TaxID=2498849 RepID=A0A444PXB5_9MICO|nr:hypothetical protein [Labedella phragmitis]RWZ52522.1 hypothetical protein ELQ90_00760 [Labedella phragmitis]
MNPYAFSFKPSYARGGEKKPIDDLDGKGATARSAIDGALKSLKSARLKVHAEDESRSLRVTQITEYREFTFVEFEVGRAGLVGNLHQSTGGRIPYGEEDHNGTFVRAIFVYPKDAHEVYWLNERAGLTSAFSYLEEVLVAALRAATSDARITVSLAPVAEWSALESWASKVMVRELRFDAPRPGGSTQAMDVNGVHADVRFVVKPRGSLALSRLMGKNGPDRKAVFGFLTDLPLVRKTSTPNSVMRDGWRAQVSFQTPNGRQRSFGLATDDKAPTLVYPVGPQGAGISRAKRPSQREFAVACADFLSDVESALPGLKSVATAILSSFK